MSPAELSHRLLGTSITRAVTEPGARSPNRMPWADPNPLDTPGPVARETTITQPRLVNRSLFPGRPGSCKPRVQPSQLRMHAGRLPLSCRESSVTQSRLSQSTHRFTVAAPNPEGSVDLSPRPPPSSRPVHGDVRQTKKVGKFNGRGHGNTDAVAHPNPILHQEERFRGTHPGSSRPRPWQPHLRCPHR